MLKLNTYVCIIAILCTFLGCKSGRLYDGDPLPPSEVSIVYGSGTIRGIYFVERNYKGQLITGNRVEVKPGVQRLSVHLFDVSRGPFWGGDHIISFIAEPGHEYIIKCDEDYRIWVEDKNSGDVVYGERPK